MLVTSLVKINWTDCRIFLQCLCNGKLYSKAEFLRENDKQGQFSYFLVLNFLSPSKFFQFFLETSSFSSLGTRSDSVQLKTNWHVNLNDTVLRSNRRFQFTSLVLLLIILVLTHFTYVTYSKRDVFTFAHRAYAHARVLCDWILFGVDIYINQCQTDYGFNLCNNILTLALAL